jgi:Family of unknown function (DUF6338)
VHSLIAFLASTAPTTLDQAKTGSDIVTGISTVLGGGLGSILLLLPGWVVVRVYHRGDRGPALTDREFVALALFWALIVQLALLWLTVPLVEALLRDGIGPHVGMALLWVALAIYVLPVALGLVTRVGAVWVERIPTDQVRGLLRRLVLSPSDRTADAWSWAFRRADERGAMVRILLKDGKTTILGKYGSESFAPADPGQRDLFLQELWTATDTGWFERRHPRARGVWIAGDQIAKIEFF